MGEPQEELLLKDDDKEYVLKEKEKHFNFHHLFWLEDSVRGIFCQGKLVPEVQSIPDKGNSVKGNTFPFMATTKLPFQAS